MTTEANPKYVQALNDATAMVEMTDLEWTSALKQAASDLGIPFGDEMGRFVEWARQKIGWYD